MKRGLENPNQSLSTLVSRGLQVPSLEPEPSATIGRKKRNPNPLAQTPTEPSPHRPITRSISRDCNKLVSEPIVMGDTVSEQLTKLLNLFLAEQQANQIRNEKVDQLHAKLDAMSIELESTKKSMSSSSVESQLRTHKEKGNSGATVSETTGGNTIVPKFTKFDFPRYNGLEDPLIWLSRCGHYFRHQKTSEEEKVSIASYNLEGAAQLWYMQMLDDIPDPMWDEFSHQCNLRFGPDIRSNKLGELAKLKQLGTVADYQTKFEGLVARAGTLTQFQKVQLYLSGLQESISVEVELHHPKDLVTAMSMSRLYERKLNSRSASFRDQRKMPVSVGSSVNRPVKRLSREEMEERRKRGLCFNCDEPFVRGHQCKKLFWIELVEEEADELISETADEDLPPEISLNAITGIRNPQTMRLEGMWKGSHVLVLIDSGSTHSFVSALVVDQLNAQPDKRNGLKVNVANGEQISSPGICTGTKLTLGSYSFNIDLFVLPLSDFDVVLGVNWLRTLGPILWDFTHMCMSFFSQGQQIKLQGIYSSSLKKAELNAIQISPDTDIQLQKLLAEFTSLFQSPTELPPSRSCDHRIPLEPGAGPVVVRPYRYPHGQKDEIERQCSAMLQQGIIRPSRSPFSSPVILVPKADGTWRLCVDYRELNAKTIKDKFPIPVIDELLDELGGAQFFTKLDLLSGYHQVSMYPPDIEKTAFRTHHGHFEFLVMPFGLTNAPSTFQALMNEVFQPYLRKFILVFFDDILVFSRTWAEHIHHLRLVFQLLAANQLFLKKSKCSFAQKQVAYLGHVITSQGVQVDQSKISAITTWPKPTTIKGLRGFLGLTSYYRKFVHNYGIIAAPLTAMLRKNSFTWTPAAVTAFEELKHAMTTTPVLILPDFEQLFIIECDASDSGMGAVLLQHNQPVAFFSRPMVARHHNLPAYEKELIGLVKAVRHWNSYLWGRNFIVRTDHYSLKFLLEQRSLSSSQQHWVSKLMGFSFTVEYKAGRHNKVADALSRRDTDQSILMAVSMPQIGLFSEIQREQQESSEIQQLISQVQKGTAAESWSFKQGLLFYKNRVFLPKNSPSIQHVVTALHNQGHEGYQKTLYRITRDFFWPGMKIYVRDFVKACGVCQRNKSETMQPAELLQPLHVPSQIWADISMDFVEGLPISKGKSILLVVIDRFSKYSHFIPLSHPYTAVSVARSFFDHIFKLHGLPETIVSDRDVIFTSSFWKELFRLCGTQLSFSSAYHPQTDGQTEVVNRTIEMYLRCFTSEQPNKWIQWLSWAEYCYNTSYHSSLKATPFEVVYGRPPPRLLSYYPGSSLLEAVDHELKSRDDVLKLLRQHLLQAQQRMKHSYDKNHRALEFQVGDQVLLRLQPYHQGSVTTRRNQKLSAKFYGPFLVLDRIGTMAYKLKLPAESKIHPVFHVSRLKAYHAEQNSCHSELPLPMPVSPLQQPLAILDHRIRSGQLEILVHWNNLSPADASWENAQSFHNRYPKFALEDKCIIKEGSNVSKPQDKPIQVYKRFTHGLNSKPKG